MPVSTKHADYLGSEYEKMRDFFIGQRAVKAKGVSYLKKTGGMIAQGLVDETAEAAAYEAYLDRAMYTGLIAPAVFGLSGIAHRVQWEVELPPRMEYLRESATKSGITLDALIESITPEVLLTGHHGLLADFDQQGEAKIVTYPAESIINWRELDWLPTMVVLKETELVPLLNDRFATKDQDNYLVLELIEGTYSVESHLQNDADLSDNYLLVTQETPSLQKGYIPFYVAGSQSTSLKPDKIPLSDMASHLLRAYQVSADLGQILHMTCSPTYHGFGIPPEERPVVFGPDVVITYSNPDSKAEYVEVSGDGIDKNQDEINNQLTLAKASSHELAETGSRVESGEALATRVANKTATLRSVVINSANAVEQVLRAIADMTGNDRNSVNVRPNLTFTQEQVDATLVTAFNNAVVANNVPRSLLWKYLRDSDAVGDADDEELKAELEEQQEANDERAMGMFERQAAVTAESDEEEDDKKEVPSKKDEDDE